MSEVISPRQREFAIKLLQERLATLQCSTVTEAAEKLHLDNLTKKDASIIIDRLMKMPVDPDPSLPALVAAAPRHGVNGSPGACTSCKHIVEARTGFYYGTKGAWSVHHKQGECSAAPVVTATAAPTVDVEPGIYLTNSGEVALLYVTKNKHLAGKALRGGYYMYQAGLVMTIRSLLAVGKAHKITAAEAAAYGAAHSHCVACGLDLTHPFSDPTKGGAGYGPVCAKKYGWPWGTVKVMS